jgi:CubicO group peptidase (beta-lactamase class C family)
MRTLRSCLALGSILLAAAGLEAQSLSPELAAKVDEVFKKWDRPDSPGCALGIYKDGQIVYKHGYGMANLNDDVPITPATVFHVASMSKQFTAASILLLAQQGKLSWTMMCTNTFPSCRTLGNASRSAPDAPYQRPAGSMGAAGSGWLALLTRPDHG